MINNIKGPFHLCTVSHHRHILTTIIFGGLTNKETRTMQSISVTCYLVRNSCIENCKQLKCYGKWCAMNKLHNFFAGVLEIDILSKMQLTGSREETSKELHWASQL
jgi:hypothetical protein